MILFNIDASIGRPEFLIAHDLVRGACQRYDPAPFDLHLKLLVLLAPSRRSRQQYKLDPPRPLRARVWTSQTHTYLGEIGDAKDKADGIKDVALATAVQTSDSVEEGVEVLDVSPLGVGFEPIDYHLFDVHEGYEGRVGRYSKELR